ncbi:SirB2 family protein [Noviherbaspirillum sp. DKR-6]|uniref:SirB2 family protein n=1 Tax=Noviherbaspirillum pedocola TaxID=2801341 RepID=A0A934SWE5_9BURK|nr:SirB2 family protein [Noviherbaspirillum pedocola]
MDYFALKHFHMTCAALSGGFFLLRGGWMLRGSTMLQRAWVKRLPHVIDTALLASAVFLAVISAQYPLAQPWLTAKVGALLLYIVLGSIALKRGRTRTLRALAFGAAILVFAYIVAVAVTKQPLVLS